VLCMIHGDTIQVVLRFRCAVYDTWWHHSSGAAVPLCCVWYMVTPFNWCCGSAVLCMIHGDTIQVVLRFRCAVYDTWWHHPKWCCCCVCWLRCVTQRRWCCFL